MNRLLLGDCAQILPTLTRPRGHVLDCFAGSFTTGVAAQQLGFRCTGIEMNPAYVKIGIRRLGGAA